MKKIRVFGFNFIIELSAKKTLWWHNINKKDHPNQRADTLIGIERIYVRDLGVYILSVKIGRLRVLVSNDRHSANNLKLQKWLSERSSDEEENES